jgi:hypothetical protein
MTVVASHIKRNVTVCPSDGPARDGGHPLLGRQPRRLVNALAESIIGPFKAEVLERKGPSRHRETVEFAKLTVDG